MSEVTLNKPTRLAVYKHSKYGWLNVHVVSDYLEANNDQIRVSEIITVTFLPLEDESIPEVLEKIKAVEEAREKERDEAVAEACRDHVQALYMLNSIKGEFLKLEGPKVAMNEDGSLEGEVIP
jgi:hypothetical protein